MVVKFTSSAGTQKAICSTKGYLTVQDIAWLYDIDL